MAKIPSHMVQNLYCERKLSIKLLSGDKSKKKTNNSTFSATNTYIKLTLVSFFYFFFYAPFPYDIMCLEITFKNRQMHYILHWVQGIVFHNLIKPIQQMYLLWFKLPFQSISFYQEEGCGTCWSETDRWGWSTSGVKVLIASDHVIDNINWTPYFEQLLAKIELEKELTGQNCLFAQ